MTAPIARQYLITEIATQYGYNLQYVQDEVAACIEQLEGDDLYDEENDRLSADGADAVRRDFDYRQLVGLPYSIFEAAMLLQDAKNGLEKATAAFNEATANRDKLVRTAVSLGIHVEAIVQASGLDPDEIRRIGSRLF